MAKVLNEVRYRDFDFTFNAHPITGKLLLKKNNEAVKQALKLLILTNFYERPYRSRLGGNVTANLFEHYTQFTEDKIRSAIETSIKNYESGRIQLLDIRFNGSPDTHSLSTTIIVRPINSVELLEIDINFERIR